MLAQGEAEIAAGRFTEAETILGTINDKSYTGEDLERFKLALASARFGTGDAWGAFGVLRNYMEDHPLTSRVEQIERLTFDIGKTLIGGTRGFWVFWSDEDDGVYVLEHFVRRFGTSELASDAHHLLGEIAFKRRRWDQAQEHFRQITMFHERSAWVPKAMFRYAMAGFNALAGPDYDMQRLERTRQELESVVANERENLDFREAAEAALSQTRQWLAQKHVSIADFYATIGNEPGCRYHLSIAAQRFANTVAGQQAAARLAPERAATPVEGGS